MVAAAAAATPSAEPLTVAEAAARIASALHATPTAGGEAAAALAALARDVDVLRERTIMLFGARRRAWGEDDRRLGAALDQWARALRAGDDAEVASARAAAQRAWQAVRAHYPAEALTPLPALWTCPMHPEVMIAGAGGCPTCGMPLDPIYETQPRRAPGPVVRAAMLATTPLVVGQRAELRIRLLFAADGRPVTLEDLEEAHTRKIHLLIVDLSETDYHHEHPEPVAPGEYAFTITPRRPGPYRVWADLKPVATQVQEYAVADIPAAEPFAAPAGDEPETRVAEAGGYRFALTLDAPAVRVRETVHGRVRVADPDGRPCRDLEVVMGAFGHFVGFLGYTTVLHMHPIGPPELPADARGGPELEFYFRSPDPGLVRLFTQVRIGGRDLFPRFVVRVDPRPPLGGAPVP